jgi:D-arabinose 1-dehydrogenase-like Zn-dependent alcohol dehydrogenase
VKCPKHIYVFQTRTCHRRNIVVDEHFVLRVPSNLGLAGAAPLLCAGITRYSPIRHWGVTRGKKVGLVGLGGLGQINADVEVIPIQKVKEGYERLLKSDIKYRFSIDMASLKSE